MVRGVREKEDLGVVSVADKLAISLHETQGQKTFHLVMGVKRADESTRRSSEIGGRGGGTRGTWGAGPRRFSKM